MDPGTILAIVELSATTLSCIGKYYVGVKNARADIQRLSNEVEGFHDVLQKVQELVQSSQATRLPISTSFTNVAKQSLLDITALEKRLNPSKKERIMKRVGVRALAWPLTSKEVDECVTKLERYKSTLSLALNADQTSLLIDIDANVINLTQNQDLAEQNRQLATLPCAVGASFDSYFRQHESRCVPNTRVDLLNRLQKWSTDHERCIFWLNGMAGTGKSTIARTVAHIFYEQKSLGASFFFSRGVGDLGHAAHFVCTIAHQLADALPLLKRYICEAITKHHNIAMQGLRNQWKELVVQPLSKLNGQWPTLSLVIDALDECENQEDVKLILQLFVETKGLAGVNFGIFVTSRPETPIRLGFREMPDIVHQDLVLQDIPRSVVEHDITVFLQYQLYQIGSKRDIQGWPDETSIKLLVQASDCLFIYAATVCRFVGDPHWSPEQRLHLILQSEARGSRPTAKLDEMYTQILRCSITADQDMDEKAELGKRFKNVIGTIVLLFDVLPVPVLAALLSIPTKEVDLSLEPLHSLLRISRLPNLPIRLLHPSFRDFLLDHERCRNSYFWVNQRTVDQNIVTNCLQLLSNSLRKDICALKMPGASAPKLYDDIKFFLPIHVQYACQYWVDHLERLDWNSRIAVGLCDDGQVYNFLQTHLLNWLEALSLVGKTSRGIVIITKLESMLQNDEHPSLRAIVQDAKRFILSYRSIIEEAPLQIYASALVFSPKQSLIRQRYSSHFQPWILRYPLGKDNWDSCLQTLEGHLESVNAVAFSPDGKQLASGSRDQTIRIWDAATGAALQTLEGHSFTVNAVAFSPDGKQLASGSGDQTIRIWDAATGAALQTLEGHSDWVTAVAFSPDGKQLASGSRDQTIRIWDAATGAALQTLEGHSFTVNAVAFSPDGKQLTSGSRDQTIRIWDAATGAALQTLEGHSDWVTAVAFSPDGKQLTSGSRDQTIRIWDAATGAALQTLEGHSFTVNAVAFSPDGKQLASGSGDQTIRIWDAATGAALQTLEGHSDWVTAVAFSPDGKQLASGSGDRTIRIWDVAKGATLQTFEANTAITMLSYSSDGSIVTNGGRLDAISLHDDVVISSSPSPLGSRPGALQPNIFVQDEWIVYKESRMLWLPPDYRHLCSAVHENIVCLGHYSGQVSIFEFLFSH